MEQDNQPEKLTYFQILQQECTLKELNCNIQDHNKHSKNGLLEESKEKQQSQQDFPPMLIYLTQMADEEGNQASKLFDSQGIFLDFVNIEETDENLRTLKKLTDNFSDKLEPICLKVSNHSLIVELLEGTHELTVGHCISSFTPINRNYEKGVSNLLENLQVQSWKDSKQFEGLHNTLKKLLIRQQISPIVEQLKKRDYRPHTIVSSHKATLGFLKQTQLQKNRIILLRKPSDTYEEDISSATHSSVFYDHRLKRRLPVKFDFKNKKDFCRNNEQSNFIAPKETQGKANAATVLSQNPNKTKKQLSNLINVQQGQQEQSKIQWIAPTKRKKIFRKEEEEEEEEEEEKGGERNRRDQKQAKPFESKDDTQSKQQKNLKELQFQQSIIGYEDYCEQQSGESKDCYDQELDQEHEESATSGQPSFFLKLKEGKQKRMLKNQQLTIEELDALSKKKKNRKKTNKDGSRKRSKGRYLIDQQHINGVYNNDLSMQLNDKVRGKYVITVDQQKRKKLKGLPNRDYFIVSDEEQERKIDYFKLLSQKFQLQQLQLPEQKLRIRKQQILSNLKQEQSDHLKNKIEEKSMVEQKAEGATIKDQIKEERGSDEEVQMKNRKIEKYQLKEQQLNCKEVFNFQNNELLEQNVIKSECSIKEE